MTNSNKILAFFFGLSLGLLAGAGFFIFKIDNYINLLTKRITDTIITPTLNNYANTASITVLRTAKIALPEKTSDSMFDLTIEQTRLKILQDSLNADTFLFANSGNIIVRTEELISARIIEVRTLSVGSKDTPSNKTDSLLQVVSGIRDDSRLLLYNYKIEFWQSPLNYKGFKMTKNRLLLFGVNPYEDIRLYRLNDVLYLKNQQDLYKLDYTGDFKRFEPIKDPILASRIEQDNLSLQQQ